MSRHCIEQGCLRDTSTGMYCPEHFADVLEWRNDLKYMIADLFGIDDPWAEADRVGLGGLPTVQLEYLLDALVKAPSDQRRELMAEHIQQYKDGLHRAIQKLQGARLVEAT